MIGEGFHFKVFIYSKDKTASFLVTPAYDMDFWALKMLILLLIPPFHH